MADVSRTVDIIFRDQDKMTAVKTIPKSLNNLGENAANAEGKVEDLNEEVTNLGERPRKSVDAAAAALKALAASLVVKDFIDANVQAETFERTMTLLTGSTEQANREFEYATEISNTLGLEVLNTAKNYSQLFAATKGTALQGQATRDIFEAVVTAMANLGKSSFETEGALLAITQIVSKGKVSMEELRQQLGDRLPGALQIAARSLGVTTTELEEIVKGGIAAEEFLPGFAQELRNTFGDVSYVDTYTASLNRLRNEITSAELQIGNAGGFDVLTKAVQLTTASIVGAITSFDLLGKAIGIFFGALQNSSFSIADLINPVSGGIGAVKAIASNFTQVSEELSQAVDDAAERSRGAREALLGISEANKEIEVSASDALVPIEAQGFAIIHNLKQTEKFGKAINKTAVDLERIASNERIAIFEGNIDFGIAKLEADTEKAVALIDNLGEAATSSRELIGDLFGELNEAGNFRDRFRLEDQIDQEAERLEELHALQKRQIEQQLRLDRAREDAIRNGGTEITVNAAGLEPALAFIFREVLNFAQVQFNSGDGSEFLLGPQS